MVPDFNAKVNILRALVRRGVALSVYRGTTISNAVRDGLLCPMGPETPQQCWSAAYKFRTMLHEWWEPIFGILYEPSNYWHGRGSRCVPGNRGTGIVRFYPGGLGLRCKAYKVVLSAGVPTFYLAFYELMVQSKSSVYPTAVRLVPGPSFSGNCHQRGELKNRHLVVNTRLA